MSLTFKRVDLISVYLNSHHANYCKLSLEKHVLLFRNFLSKAETRRSLGILNLKAGFGIQTSEFWQNYIFAKYDEQAFQNVFFVLDLAAQFHLF